MDKDKAYLQDIIAAMGSAVGFVGDRTLEQFIAEQFPSGLLLKRPGMGRRVDVWRDFV